jgi:flavin reductase (DIM6/NTAB) family NADH-FMN oxidoreductase RutF
MPDIRRALGLLPTAAFVMTSSFEGKRNGMIVTRVMKAADEPACVCVAVQAGQRLATLIRDSHAFALCSIDPASRLMHKRFGPEEIADPFDTLEAGTLATGSPVLLRSAITLDCEVLRHLDLEADHEIYVGQVLGAVVRGNPVSPALAMAELGHRASATGGVNG